MNDEAPGYARLRRERRMTNDPAPGMHPFGSPASCPTRPNCFQRFVRALTTSTTSPPRVRPMADKMLIGRDRLESPPVL